MLRSGLAALCLALLSAPAVAGPPFITDDPEPVDYRHWEFYDFSQGIRAKSETSGVAPSCDCNYGVLPNVQLHLQPGVALHRASRGPLTYGAADTELGVKYRFVAQDKNDWTPSVALYPLLEAPTGDAARGLGAGRTRVFLPLWAQKDIGDWTTFGGGGYWINPVPGGRNYGFMGWVLQRKIDEKLALGVELFHQTPSEIGGMQSTGFNLGGTYDFTDQYHLLFSAGKGVQHARETNQFSWYLGLQVTGGEEPPKAKQSVETSGGRPDFSWTGFYIGAAVGPEWRTTSETDIVAYVQLPASSRQLGGAVFGALAGIDYQLGAVVFGIENDVEAGAAKPARQSLIGTSFRNDVRTSYRLRGGLANGRMLFYLTGGAALANGFANALGESFGAARLGWTLGAGLEYAFADSWSGRVEYRHSDLGVNAFSSDNFDGNLYRLRPKDDQARLAIAYRFDFTQPHGLDAKQ